MRLERPLALNALDEFRRDYNFRLPIENRCETCRHAAPETSYSAVLRARCRLLEIIVANVRTSACPGWEMDRRRHERRSWDGE